MNNVACRDCAYFQSDTIGDGQGIGHCRQYEHYKEKGKTGADLRKLLLELGNDPADALFWGGKEKTRSCKKYQEKSLDVHV